MNSKAKIVSLSGGKDSTAILLKLLENNEPIDEVIFCDTTVEWDEMHEHLDLLEKNTGIHNIRLQPPAGKDFHYYFKQLKEKNCVCVQS